MRAIATTALAAGMIKLSEPNLVQLRFKEAAGCLLRVALLFATVVLNVAAAVAAGRLSQIVLH